MKISLQQSPGYSRPAGRFAIYLRPLEFRFLGKPEKLLMDRDGEGHVVIRTPWTTAENRKAAKVGLFNRPGRKGWRRVQIGAEDTPFAGMPPFPAYHVDVELYDGDLWKTLRFKFKIPKLKDALPVLDGKNGSAEEAPPAPTVQFKAGLGNKQGLAHALKLANDTAKKIGATLAISNDGTVYATVTEQVQIGLDG
jgi:hypothetical protein